MIRLGEKTKWLMPALAALILLPSTLFAQGTGDLTVTSEKIRFSKFPLVEGQKTRIYATIANIGQVDASGNVQFHLKNKNEQIGTDQPISVIKEKTDDVFVDWVAQAGTHSLMVRIIPWNPETDDPSNNVLIKEIFVDIDTDKDGVGNQTDPDDDNDGTPDLNDAFPLDANEQKDSDKDGVGDNTDPDDDNDGVHDNKDAFPTDSKETLDSDKDGQGDNKDSDDDNDGLTDTIESSLGTNKILADSDSDKYTDKKDQFPLDTHEWEDFDQDKTGDNADTDDDNDDILDEQDDNDHNPAPKAAVKIPTGILNTNEVIRLSAENSIDTNGYITDYLWEIDGQVIGQTMLISYKPAQAGSHEIKLTVTDNEREESTSVTSLKVVDKSYLLGLSAALTILALATFGLIRYSKSRKLLKKA